MPNDEELLPKEGRLPPRVEVDGDDTVMIDPKAAVMEMLKNHPQIENGGLILMGKGT